ncbi:hypothetical protein, partial [Pseudomonas amygdali]
SPARARNSGWRTGFSKCRRRTSPCVSMNTHRCTRFNAGHAALARRCST